MPKQFQLFAKSCLICQRPLVLKIARDLTRKNYCSPSCRSKGAADTERFKTSEERHCVKCLKVFTAINSRNIYCNKNCQTAAAAMRYLLKGYTLEKHLSKLATRSNRQLRWQDLLELWHKQNGKCALTQLPMTFEVGKGFVKSNVSIDRKVPGLPYEISNLQLVCKAANMMKQDFTEEELLMWCKLILENKNSFSF